MPNLKTSTAAIIAVIAAIGLYRPSHANSISLAKKAPAAEFQAVTPKPEGRSYMDITIENVKIGWGDVIIELFDSKDGFETGQAIGRTKLDDDSAIVRTCFKKLASQKYAYRAFQDQNGNGMLDKNSERYLVQGRTKTVTNAETWEEAKIYVPYGRLFRTSKFSDVKESIVENVEMSETNEEETFADGVSRLYAVFASN